ncbi:prostaglandin E2 receptor EP4 subtype-like isoform X2 [Ostrea edulis]|uniref:prostaglandin E2 receptor EP4 subtype-like isoform X2 n=1 Tax=Ostrea edulis TaxID=37623 RepID=UPI0024AEF4B6|nr:prostaglandin E2 receptor EP4 subtype-like isoform X2 [Ostrea edulis]
MGGNITENYAFDLCYRNDTATSWVPASLEYIFGTMGNVIALVLLWINRREHQWSSFYKLFTGLAITDFLGIFLTYPFVMHRYATGFTWCYPKPLCEFVSFTFLNAQLSGALLICAMSVDRFMHLKYSAGDETSSKRYTLILVGIWITSSSIASLHILGVGNTNLYFPGSWCYFDFVRNTTGNRIMSYFYSTIGFIIILVIITTNVITIYRICRDPELRVNLLDGSRVSGFYDSHVMIFLTAVTVLFVILWTPLVVDIFLHATNIRTQHENDAVELWLFRMSKSADVSTVRRTWIGRNGRVTSEINVFIFTIAD